MNEPYNTDGDHGAMCSGPGSIHIILRNWNINFRTSKYAVGCWSKRIFGRVSLMILSIGTLIWTSRQTGSYRNWTANVLKSCSKRRTVHQHIMHSLLGVTLVRLPGNVGMVVGHQCCPIHWTIHLDASTWHRVVIHFEAQQRKLLHRNSIKPLKTLNKEWDLLLYVSPHTFSRKFPTEHSAELFSVMRMAEPRQNSWTFKACVVCCKICKRVREYYSCMGE